MKKLSKFALLCCFLALGTSAFAQDTEYPRYGFWSNWSIGINGSFNWQLDVDSYYGIQKPGWGSGFNAGLGLSIEQKLNHVWSWRMRYNWPSMFAKCDDPNKTTRGTMKDRQAIPTTATMDNHAAWTVEVKFSINDAIAGYNPVRRGSIYLFVGAGLGYSYNYARGFSRVSTMVDGGLGFSYKVGKHSTLYAEAEADVVADAPRPDHKLHDMNILGTVGYMFNFGVTPADRAAAAQRAMLTQERFDALTNQANQLKRDLEVAKQEEQKLEGQVAQLTNENQQLQEEALVRGQQVADSLKGVIDQLKADQLTYYAIPFSVLFPNDQWIIPESQYIKIKAIARVMKDDPSLKLTLIGFCDYTASHEYNMALSEKRVREVKRVMIEKYGVDGDRLAIDWKGRTVAFGDIKFSVNRRVSFYRVIE